MVTLDKKYKNEIITVGFTFSLSLLLSIASSEFLHLSFDPFKTRKFLGIPGPLV
jgi:hypothetical protein